ncbi:MAG: hypothetical protein KBG28_31965 [Kofleriaceae bacterium]|nr:hypothetical protein [Kofleriaceae bacterium]
MRAGGVTTGGLLVLGLQACSFQPAPPLSPDATPVADARGAGPDAGLDAAPPPACLGPQPQRARLCLQFDDALDDQIATDGSGRGLHAALTNIRRATRDAPAGTTSPAAAPEASGAIVVDDDPGLDLPDAFTLLAWAKHRTGPGNAGVAFGLISKPGQYELRLGYNNRPTCQVATSAGVKVAIQNQTLAPDQWYLLACTYDGAQLCVHSNWAGGTVETCVAATGPVVTGSPLALLAGTLGPPPTVFAGELDAIHVFEVALERAALCQLAGRPSC